MKALIMIVSVLATFQANALSISAESVRELYRSTNQVQKLVTHDDMAYQLGRTNETRKQRAEANRRYFERLDQEEKRPMRKVTIVGSGTR